MSCNLKFLYNKFFRITKKLLPTHFLIIGFFLIEFIGSVLLWLPISSHNFKSVGIVDAFFTATSALCVTGLTVKNTLLQWSLFGKIVIMLLIEIGGLGFMTIITVFFIFAGKKITLKERLIIQESLNQLNYTGIVALVKRIFNWVIIIQGIGALVLSIRFMFEPNINFFKAIFMGIFHSISSYCNAGFDIIGEKSMAPYVKDFTINFTVMTLITLGAIGYTVMADIIYVFRDLAYKKLSFSKKFSRLKLHSKLAIISTVILSLLGAFIILIFEFNNTKTLGQLNFFDKIMASLFQSISSRTTGFDTIDEIDLHQNSKIITLILMFIGGSPGGTAGGVKTVTVAILILSVICAIKGSNKIEAFKRTISFYTLQRALAIIFFNFSAVILSTLIISELNPNIDFIDVLFETTSAVGTVGLSLGLVANFSVLCKLIICFDMIIGKLGPVSIAVALLLRHRNAAENLINYPKEKVIVG
jgi:Trk-type K+ transport systems, membrane components